MHGIAKFDFENGKRFAARTACLFDCNTRPANAGSFVVLDLSGSGLLLRFDCP